MTRLALILALIATPAMAHTHGTQIFDAICCNGNTISGDCQPIPPEAVEYESHSGLIKITLNPGDHPMVTKRHVYKMKQSEVRYSSDGGYYACLYPTEAQLRCLYLPPNGS